jgi:hypothetical protein
MILRQKVRLSNRKRKESTSIIASPQDKKKESFANAPLSPSRETYPSKGVSVEAIGEEIGHILLQEPNHGVLLPPYRTQPRADAFERVLTASVVQEPSDWLVPTKSTSRFF